MNLEWQNDIIPMQIRFRLVDTATDRIVGRVYDNQRDYTAFDMDGAIIGEYATLEAAKKAVENAQSK